MEAKTQISAKLKQAKINPIDWPKVPDYVEDSVVSAVKAAAAQHGDNQYESSKNIKVYLQSLLGGNWTVIICPADQKTYNIHYTPAILNNKGYVSFDFTFEFNERRYLIFRTA